MPSHRNVSVASKRKREERAREKRERAKRDWRVVAAERERASEAFTRPPLPGEPWEDEVG